MLDIKNSNVYITDKATNRPVKREPIENWQKELPLDRLQQIVDIMEGDNFYIKVWSSDEISKNHNT